MFRSGRSRQYGKMQHMHDIMRSGRSQNETESASATYHEEYARVNSIVECREVILTYYADYAGKKNNGTTRLNVLLK